MNILYTLTPELRIKLKKPLGTLIRGSYTETMKKLLEGINEEKPSTIISVGDTVSKNIAENHVTPQLAIVDNRVMRRSIQPIQTSAEKIIHVKNPPGTITEEAVTAIQTALKSHCHVKIIVDGEEDLLTLIAVLYAPENAFVVYGQPYEGIVIVKATPEKKAEISEILKTMETTRKTK
ncbi:MAG: GTP-dependent dephospho-CoA kinase family protein [Candidatus Bathyarchaeales archaeon]